MATIDCATRLAEAEAAKHNLTIGKAVAEIWDGEFRKRYTQANVSDLDAYIARLKAECGCADGSANAAQVRRPFRVSF